MMPFFHTLLLLFKSIHLVKVCSKIPEKNTRVDAVWQQMNKGISKEKLNSIIKKSPSNSKGTSSKPSSKTSSSVSLLINFT